MVMVKIVTACIDTGDVAVIDTGDVAVGFTAARGDGIGCGVGSVPDTTAGALRGAGADTGVTVGDAAG